MRHQLSEDTSWDGMHTKKKKPRNGDKQLVCMQAEGKNTVNKSSI